MQSLKERADNWIEAGKHRTGMHNQKRHGWRGSDLSSARRAMRSGVSEDYQGKTTPAAERDAARSRYGMAKVDKINKDFAKDMTNPYGNRLYRTNSPLDYTILTMREKLMPPQYNEFISAIEGKTSAKTREYWLGHAKTTNEYLVDDGKISESQGKIAETRINILAAGVNANKIVKNSSGEDAIWKPTGGDSNFHDAQSELAAYKLSKLLASDVVPHTEIKVIDGIEGSAQKIVPGQTLSGAKKISKGDLDDVVALDYIMQNPDRHANNILVNGERVYAIDNGHAGWAKIGKQGSLDTVGVSTVFERNPILSKLKAYKISTGKIKKWAKITREQFDKALSGVIPGFEIPLKMSGTSKRGDLWQREFTLKSGNVNFENAWINFQSLIAGNGKIQIGQ